mgnify:CR=1 FL=1
MAEIKIKTPDGNNAVTLATANGGDATVTLPKASIDFSSAGSDGQFLKTDGAGTLSFATVTAGAGGATGLDLNDNTKARFGTGNDLEIFHDGSHSRIKDTGTGALVIQTDNFYLNKADDSATMIHASEDGIVRMPKNPVCIASRTGNQAFSSGTFKYPLNAVNYERHQGSSNFDTTNYRFTCPTDGVYLFDATLNIYGFDGDDMHMFIKKNGSANYYIVRRDDWTGDSNVHGGAILYGGANDYFELWLWASDSGTFSAASDWIRFSIVLLG